MAYLTITMTATTARINTANIIMAMTAGIAFDTTEGDVASDKMESVTVSFWTPNSLLTLQVYSKLLMSVRITVNSSKESVPFSNTLPCISSHSIVSTARSVVQFSAAEDSSGREDLCPVTLIPVHIQCR